MIWLSQALGAAGAAVASPLDIHAAAASLAALAIAVLLAPAFIAAPRFLFPRLPLPLASMPVGRREGVLAAAAAARCRGGLRHLLDGDAVDVESHCAQRLDDRLAVALQAVARLVVVDLDLDRQLLAVAAELGRHSPEVDGLKLDPEGGDGPGGRLPAGLERRLAGIARQP